MKLNSYKLSRNTDFETSLPLSKPKTDLANQQLLHKVQSAFLANTLIFRRELFVGYENKMFFHVLKIIQHPAETSLYKYTNNWFLIICCSFWHKNMRIKLKKHEKKLKNMRKRLKNMRIKL